MPQLDGSVADDAAWPDAGPSQPPSDAGPALAGDSGLRDSGLHDSGVHDSGLRDSGLQDAGARDDAGPDPELCPPGRFTSGTVHFHYDVDPSERVLLDLTVAAPFFRSAAREAILPFPWSPNSHPQVVSLPDAQYVAMRFDVPADLPAGWRGSIGQNETAPGPLVELAISRRCGDFSPIDASCHIAPRSLGGLGLGWKIAGGPVVACPLTPGESYYLNIRFQHPLSSTESPYYCNAAGTRCKLTLAQYSWPPG